MRLLNFKIKGKPQYMIISGNSSFNVRKIELKSDYARFVDSGWHTSAFDVGFRIMFDISKDRVVEKPKSLRRIVLSDFMFDLVLIVLDCYEDPINDLAMIENPHLSRHGEKLLGQTHYTNFDYYISFRVITY